MVAAGKKIRRVSSSTTALAADNNESLIMDDNDDDYTTCTGLGTIETSTTIGSKKKKKKKKIIKKATTTTAAAVEVAATAATTTPVVVKKKASIAVAATSVATSPPIIKKKIKKWKLDDTANHTDSSSPSDVISITSCNNSKKKKLPVPVVPIKKHPPKRSVSTPLKKVPNKIQRSVSSEETISLMAMKKHAPMTTTTTQKRRKTIQRSVSTPLKKVPVKIKRSVSTEDTISLMASSRSSRHSNITSSTTGTKKEKHKHAAAEAEAVSPKTLRPHPQPKPKPPPKTSRNKIQRSVSTPLKKIQRNISTEDTISLMASSSASQHSNVSSGTTGTKKEKHHHEVAEAVSSLSPTTLRPHPQPKPRLKPSLKGRNKIQRSVSTPLKKIQRNLSAEDTISLMSSSNSSRKNRKKHIPGAKIKRSVSSTLTGSSIIDEKDTDEVSILTGDSLSISSKPKKKKRPRDKTLNNNSNNKSFSSLSSSVRFAYFQNNLNNDDNDENQNYDENANANAKANNDHADADANANVKIKMKNTKNNKFATNNPNGKLKILPDGTTKVSVPKQKRTSSNDCDIDNSDDSDDVSISDSGDDDDNDDHDDDDDDDDDNDNDNDGQSLTTTSLSLSKTRSFSPRRISLQKLNKGTTTRRSNSADYLTEMSSSLILSSRSTTNNNKNKIKNNNNRLMRGKSGIALSSPSSSISASTNQNKQQRLVPPTRLATRKKRMSNVRSVSADHLHEMKRMGSSNSTSASSTNTSKIRNGGISGSGGGGRLSSTRGRPPPRRGMKRNASAPIGGGRTVKSASSLSQKIAGQPLRFIRRQQTQSIRGKSLHIEPQQATEQQQKQPSSSLLRWKRSKDMTPNDHVEMLEELVETTKSSSEFFVDLKGDEGRGSDSDDNDDDDDDDATGGGGDQRRPERGRRAEKIVGIGGGSRSLSPSLLLERPKPQGILRTSSHHQQKQNRPPITNNFTNNKSLPSNSYHSTASASTSSSNHHSAGYSGGGGGRNNDEIIKSSMHSTNSSSYASARRPSVVFDISAGANYASDDDDSIIEEVPIKFDGGGGGDNGYNDNDDNNDNNHDNHDNNDIHDNSKNEKSASNKASKPRPSLKRQLSRGSFLGFSNHSYMSNRSQMSVDSKENLFEDDPQWKVALRYMRLLAPHKGETDLKRNIRLFTWTAMLLDFIAAMVAVTTYKGATKCCDDPIFDILLDLNWDTLFRVVTALYIVLVLAEIIPVIKKGMPFNIVNPTIGFIITIGMFFDDSIAEAVAMWVIEALAIFFEFLVYRVNARIFRETNDRLKQIDESLENVKKSRRLILETSRHNSRYYSSQDPTDDMEMNGRKSPVGSKIRHQYDGDSDSGDDGDSLSGHSFGDDDDDDDDFSEPSFDEEKNTTIPETALSPPRVIKSTKSRETIEKPARKPALTTSLSRNSSIQRTKSTQSNVETNSSTHSYCTSGRGRTPTIPGERKQNQLLRDRRILREKKKAQEKDLQYHFVGTILNVSLAVIALILIIAIASTGGLCFANESINIFSTNQLAKCSGCRGDDTCQVCDTPEGNQCYYPYY